MDLNAARAALDAGLRIYEVQTFSGSHDYYAASAENAIEQHTDAFGGASGVIVIDCKDKTRKRQHELEREVKP